MNPDTLQENTFKIWIHIVSKQWNTDKWQKKIPTVSLASKIYTGWKIISGHDHHWATDELSLSKIGLAGNKNKTKSDLSRFSSFASQSCGDNYMPLFSGAFCRILLKRFMCFELYLSLLKRFVFWTWS